MQNDKFLIESVSKLIDKVEKLVACTAVLTEKIETLNDKISENQGEHVVILAKVNENSNRLNKLETLKWKITGGVFVLASLTGFLSPVLIDLLKSWIGG